MIVHGDIRHLETRFSAILVQYEVHGDIRHLENIDAWWQGEQKVHGDIRHLEMSFRRHIFK